MLIKNDKLLKQSEFKLEKDIQKFVEDHIPDILGEEYEFVCTEFSVGNFRIDSLAFNKETKSFIIIEDKKVESKSLLAQGLTYLKLLKDRKAEFILKYNDVKKTNYNVNDIDMSQSRVVFFSPYYNKYEIYSSDYQNIPFDLYKITKYEEDIISIEKIAKTSKEKLNNEILSPKSSKDDVDIKVYTEDYHTSYSNENIQELYEELKSRILMLGDIDIDVKKAYIAFKGRRNIVDIVFHQKKLGLFINLKKGILVDPMNIAMDMSNSGHLGNGDYCVEMTKMDDIDKVIPLIKQSLEINKK